jgi:sterol desaturase/sphingolipid hydroxylase (fatty acid hydroxylase superfamily)
MTMTVERNEPRLMQVSRFSESIRSRMDTRRNRVVKREHTVESTSEGWNWAHLGALALLPAYAWTAHAAGWSASATLAVQLAWVLLWFGVAEHLWPRRPQWRARVAARRRDGVFFSANVVADALGDWLVRAAVVGALVHTGGTGLARGLPLWLAVPAALLLSEFTAYWLHRASHADGWLWRVHSVHHRPSELNVTNNVTTHPINVLLLKVAKLLPLVALGFDPLAALWAALFQQLQSFATHANNRGRMGWLSYVVGTAELHRRHHSVRVEESLNFSTALPLWDQLFGTFGYHAVPEPQAVGVAQPQLYPGEQDWRRLLCFPLQR